VAEEEDKTKDVAKDVQVAGEPPVATNTDQQLDFSLTLRKKKRAQPKQSLKRLNEPLYDMLFWFQWHQHKSGPMVRWQRVHRKLRFFLSLSSYRQCKCLWHLWLL